jgi:hypothetical protein
MIKLAAVLALTAALAAQEVPKPAAAQAAPAAAKPEDVKSVDAIVAAVYDVISGPAGQKRDWDRMRSLFVPGARLIPAVPNQNGGASARVLDVQGYIDRSGPTLEKNGFFEHEIARKTDAFGNIAHLFSTYESRHTAADPAPFARGINSIDLLKDGDRWWIVTIYWDSERPDNPIPPQYLPNR